jgi:hypothetical protein
MDLLHNLFGRKQTGTPKSDALPTSAQHPKMPQAQVTAPKSARTAAARPGPTEIRGWLEHWLEQGGRSAAPACWNCRSFTIPLSGKYLCTTRSSPVDCQGHRAYWDARRSV